MKALVLAALLCLAVGCGADSADSQGEDPAASPPPAAPSPTAVPRADDEVTGTGLVMDTGRPELCLGPVAESWPPQCGGVPLRGWDWSTVEGGFDRQGDIRWGDFTVSGRFDGSTLTVTAFEQSSGALPEPTASWPDPRPRGSVDLERVARDVGSLPGAQGAFAAEDHVVVDVLYDDGSIQAWADGEYGAGVVRVVSALRGAG